MDGNFRLNTIITVWHPKVPQSQGTKKTYEPFRCQVKRASVAKGMLLDYLDRDEEHPNKEDWIGQVRGRQRAHGRW